MADGLLWKDLDKPHPFHAVVIHNCVPLPLALALGLALGLKLPQKSHNVFLYALHMDVEKIQLGGVEPTVVVPYTHKPLHARVFHMNVL